MVRKQRAGLVVAVVLTFAAEQVSASAPAVEASLKAGRPFVEGELLVQFKPAASEAAKNAALSKQGAKAAQKLLDKAARKDAKGDLVQAQLGKGKKLDAALLARLAADPAVEFVEPNWIYRTQRANPNDPGLGSLWGMQGATTSPAAPYGSGALAVWNAGAACSSQIHVGIIDEGVMTTHADLRANIWINPGEGSRADRKDNDRNGFIDDIHGWDFSANDASVYDGPADDHGTHVAGTVAAVANNGAGVFGVCPSAKLITAKFLGANGGTTAGAVKAVNYLTQLKLAKKINLVATNNSWGGGGYSQALYDAIRAAGNANILFVAAAGNSGLDIDATPSYPASYQLPNVIAVAAIGQNGQRAGFSNYGAKSVHIAAPGVDIVSTVPTAKGAAGYAYMSGTSMAAPHVTGAAALYASLNPCATAAQTREALLRLAVQDPQLTGVVQLNRRLDASKIRRELACGTP
ncbi:peptidase S8/S53 subtilisin kexin sedolisin [Stutzerimonas stutzeri ATCC 14405 = CCUG 16156]|uniref:S8 family peptidase n=1 Tax=Stutzerimonas stutzeri TaxID=316 RepID=UPI00025494F5|nr:S8 family peptidase [Stutzerimonas stutzeri]EHY78839.1 peptidase S8/S53 subtilisin kexin sedolisin [Stutzerimonas stutzeri ATCC 14405 = CCUG 16156]QOZ94012.1 serine protease [Stutzerimonas stutzeri]